MSLRALVQPALRLAPAGRKLFGIRACAGDRVMHARTFPFLPLFALALAAATAWSAAPAAAESAQTARDLTTQGPTGLPAALPVLALSDDARVARSEEHTSELQSHSELVC